MEIRIPNTGGKLIMIENSAVGKNYNLLILCTVLIAIFYPASVLISGPDDTDTHFIARFELGPVWQSRNDVQVPNDQGGTRFSLVDLVGHGPYPAFRFYFTWRISARHDLRLLLAPLSYTQTGIFAEPVNFVGETYQSGKTVEGTYKFNSWRLTYRYKFHHGENWNWWIGFTAKIRDAKIKLQQDNFSSEKTDLGFVPLLHIRGEYKINQQWWLLFDVDALAGGPGRAEDGTLQIGYNFNKQWSVSAGYRTVEGGADVEEVYNFAWFHYAVACINYTF
jgi:hypothetical protein